MRTRTRPKLRRWAWPRWVAAAAIAACVAPGSAHAQAGESGFATTAFEPAGAQGLNLLNVHQSEVPRHLGVSFGLFALYADDPLTLVDPDDPSRVAARPVAHRLTTELTATLGLGGVASLSVAMPLVAYQRGDDLGVFGRPGEAVEGVSPGDLRATPKVRLIDPARSGGFGMHLLVPVWVPTGDAGSFVSDGAVRVQPTIGVDYRAEAGALVGLNVGYHLREERVSHDHVSDDELRWALGLRVPAGDWLSLVGSVFGALHFGGSRDPADLAAPGDDMGASLEVAAALEIAAGDSVFVTVGGGAGLLRHVGSPDARAFLGVSFTPRGPGDGDDDGISDDQDRCPDDPEDHDGFEDDDGCPDPDNDRDGVCDPWVAEQGRGDRYADVCTGSDGCPDDAEDHDGFEDDDGCPDPDNDRDGVPDDRDRCPGDPEDRDGFEDDDGCPDPDNDGDGVCDPWVSERGRGDRYADVCTGSDGCPDEPEDADGFQDDDGCPDPDNDGDGILDGDDRCPGRAEIVNGFQDDDGCPDADTPQVRMVDDAITVRRRVTFVHRTDTVADASHGTLEVIAAILRDNPWITRLRVEAHTDSEGPDAANLALTQRRAEAVVAFLVDLGIDEHRLEARGFGEERPIAANTTPAGRAANRRVGFTITKISGAPVGEASAP